MIWFLYNTVFVLLGLAVLPGYLLRMVRRGGYRRGFLERLAHYRPAVREALAARPDRIWIHAVSVGEWAVARRLMEAFRQLDPDVAFVVSVTTSTARRLAEARLRDPDVLIYFPVDLPGVMNEVFDLVRPRALVLVDGEWWPNLLRTAARREVPVFLVNGRVSERSFRRFLRFRGLTRRLLPGLAAAHMQSAADRERLVALGARPEAVTVPGSGKYDVVDPGDPPAADFLPRLRRAGIDPDSHLVLVGGSTWPGEEAALGRLVRDFRDEVPALRLVVVPRHAERAREAVADLEALGLSVIRWRSLPETARPPGSEPPVLVVDTTGELPAFYRVADVVFVGKSLTRRGGQNLLEPVVFGKPVVVGPHMDNFRSVVEDLAREGGVVQVADESGLREALHALAIDPARRRDAGLAGQRVLRAQAGALARTAEAVHRQLAARAPR